MILDPAGGVKGLRESKTSLVLAIFQAVDEFQSGPIGADGGYFDIHQALTKTSGMNVLLGYVMLKKRRFLWP